MVGAPAAAYLRRAAFGVISVSGLVYGAVADAGSWTITPSAGVSEEFTDNSGLSSDNEDRNSDFTTTLSPGLSINGAGGRSSLNLNYNFNQTYYHRKTQADENSNRLSAVGQVELWKRVAFVDFQGSISQVLEDSTAVTSNSISGQNINRTEARSFSVSPLFRHHFGQWVETESRVRLNNTSTQSDNIENTFTQTGTLNITSGRRFALFPWSVVVLDEKTTNNGGEPSERQRRADASLSYVLSRKLTLTGTLGWEDVEDEGLDEQPSGLTWSAGFTLTPSSRTSLEFSGGFRNDNTNFSLNASHNLSSRTSITANYSDSIETSQSQISNGNSFLGALIFGPNPEDVFFFDTRTGLPPTNDTFFGLSESTFRQRRFQLNLSGSRKRNTFNGGIFLEQRDTSSTGITENVYGGNFSLSRRITPRLNGTIGLSAAYTDFGTADQREELDYRATTSLSYQVRNDLQARLTYNLTLTKVNNAPDDVMENSVSLGLTKSF